LPNDSDFQRQLADLYFHQWKYKKAQSLLKKILIDNPNDHYALWQVWEIATVEWSHEDAYLYLQQAYVACDDNPKYCFSLAQWYYDHDALDQALPLMEKMVKLRPKNIDYIVSLSHVQHKMWLTDQAKQSLLRALELDPMNITLKNYLKAL
jgi:tetratricopeptide (TPR) repeat protein